MRWWRRFGARESSDAPERFIDIPVTRDTPPELLVRLRAIDDRAECLYVGDGRWWVGRVKTDVPRRAAGRRMALRVQAGDGFRAGDRWPELRQALLMAQGFGLAFEMVIQGEPNGQLVQEFARWLCGERQREARRRQESAARDRTREQATRERDLTKWLYSRSPHGRGNPWVAQGRTPRATTTGRMI